LAKDAILDSGGGTNFCYNVLREIMAKKKKKTRQKCTKTPAKAEIVLLDPVTVKKKTQFIELFFTTSNNIAQTCATIGIGRQTYYLWLDKDPDFKKAMYDAGEKMKDYMESMLIKAADVDWRAAAFWLKIHAKDRGYKPDIALAAESGGVTDEIVIRHVYDKVPKKVKRIESEVVEKKGNEK